MAPAALSLAPRPELVRTARLVAGSAARLAGLDDDVVDDVRLAVGVAAARAVLRLTAAGLDDPVRVELAPDAARFHVHVHDATHPSVPDDDDGMALAMLEGLADRAEVRTNALDGTVVELSWPLHRSR